MIHGNCSTNTPYIVAEQTIRPGSMPLAALLLKIRVLAPAVVVVAAAAAVPSTFVSRSWNHAVHGPLASPRPTQASPVQIHPARGHSALHVATTGGLDCIAMYVLHVPRSSLSSASRFRTRQPRAPQQQKNSTLNGTPFQAEKVARDPFWQGHTSEPHTAASCFLL